MRLRNLKVFGGFLFETINCSEAEKVRGAREEEEEQRRRESEGGEGAERADRQIKSWWCCFLVLLYVQGGRGLDAAGWWYVVSSKFLHYPRASVRSTAEIRDRECKEVSEKKKKGEMGDIV